jgi:hypothetical protein
MIKERILKLLKNKRLSTGKIASLLKIDYNYALKKLNELFYEDKLIKEQETIGCYWKIP